MFTPKKTNTDDMRDAVSLYMIPLLHKKKAIISYYDPTGEKKEFSTFKNCYFYSNIKDACKAADLIILHTEWDQFKSLDFKKLVKNNKFTLYGLRNLYSIEQMKKKNIKYFSIGR